MHIVCRKSGRYSALTLYAMAGHRRNPSDRNPSTGILIRRFTDLMYVSFTIILLYANDVGLPTSSSLKYSGVLDHLIDPLKQIPV